MIFLTVGTQFPFDRLVKAVDELVGNGVITDRVIAQTGHSLYKPKNMTVMEFCSPSEFRNLICRAWLVISHVGMGTIIETTKRGKPIIVVPRKAKLGEANTDHQFDTAKVLAKEGRLLVAFETEDLPVKLKEAESFVPTQGKGSQEILDAVKAFIDDVIANRL